MLFRKNTSVGIHVTDHTLEIAQISTRRGRFFVDSSVKRTLPKGVVERGELKSPEQLRAIIEEAARNALPQPIKPRSVVFAVPDSLVYAHVFRAPSDGSDFQQHAEKSLAENVPLTKEDTMYVTHKLVSTGVNADVLLLAASKAALGPWKLLFAELHMPIVCLDIEALALYRGLMMHPKTQVIAVVDIGGQRTDISIFDGAGLRVSRQLHSAGEDISKSIADSLHVSFDEAEDRKQKEGVKDSGSPLFTAAIKALEPIGKEIRNTIEEFHEKNQRRVESVVIVGGTSQLPGLKEYMQVTSDVPVSIGAPVLAIEGVHHEDEYLLVAKNVGVAVVGLGKRMIDRAWHLDPCFVMNEEGGAKIPQKRTLEVLSLSMVFGSIFSKMSAIPQSLNQLKLLVIGIIVVIAVSSLAAYSFLGTVERFKATETADFTPNSDYIVMPSGTEISSGEQLATSTPPAGATAVQVKILQTPTGWLNVRSGSGTTFPQVARVNPGESYPLLETKGDWYHIRIGDKDGWVLAQYAERISQ